MGLLPESGKTPYTLPAQPGASTGHMADFYQQNKKLNRLVVDVVSDYFAVGDGVANDTAEIQAAAAALIAVGGGTLWFPAGSYKVDAATVLAPGVEVAGPGSGVTEINNTANDDPVFTYQSPLATADIVAGPRFRGISINAKNAVVLNQSGDFATVFNLQDFLLACQFDDVVLRGTYPDETDPDRDSDVIPDQGDLDDWGVGIRAAKCFELQVSRTCRVESFGCGARLDGCDSSHLSGRFEGNARHVTAGGHDTYGGGLKLDASFLSNRRAGGIVLDATIGARVAGYHETYSDAGMYILSTGDVNTHVEEARFADPGAVSTDSVLMLYFQPAVGLKVINNDYETSVLGGYATVQVSSASWGAVGIIAEWHDNGTLPNPAAPEMVLGIASASTLKLVHGARVVPVEGTTTINNITNGYVGQEITLFFTAGLTVAHQGGGTGNIRLAPPVDYVAGVYQTLTLIYMGSNYFGIWKEKCRS